MKVSVVGVLAAAVLSLSACGSSTEAPAAKDAKPAPPLPPSVPSTRQPTAAAQTIAIPPGATTVSVEGVLAADKDAEFVIGEEMGVVFMAHAVTPDQDLDVSVYRSDTGERIADEQPSNPAFFMARLPATLGYLVAIRSTGTPSPFTLEIEVPRRLYFDESTSATQVSGTAMANGKVEFLTPPGGTITAELAKASEDSFLTVHGLAGQRLLKAEPGARTFTGAAPQPNEELVISVNQGASSGEYTLRVQRK